MPKKVTKQKTITATKKPSSKKVVGTTQKSGLTIPLFDIKGQEVESLSVDPSIFKAQASPTLLATYVRVYLANQRAGTAQAKTRGLIKGTTRKVYKQKGTGRARHGSRKASLFVGGGVTFGPLAHDHSLKLNKKQKRKALFGALSTSLTEGKIKGLEDTHKIDPKTKVFSKFLKSVNVPGKNVLVVVPQFQKNPIFLASRNIKGVTVKEASSLNAYDVLHSQHLIFLRSSMQILEKKFTEEKHAN